MMQPEFGPHGIDIAVLAYGGGVIGGRAVRQHALVTEGVFAVRVNVLGIEGEGQRVRQLDIDAHVGVRQRKRPKAHLRAYVCALARFKIRFARSEIDVARRTELLGGLEDIGFLAFVELDLLEVIEAETSQVHLSVLGIAELHSVVVHGGVLATHRADVDSLDTSYSTVVLELDAREITNRVCHRQGVETLQLLAFEGLRNDDILG